MIKILHSADWHLASPLGGDAQLRRALLQVPEQVARVCREENCQLMLLSGDLFDGRPDPDSLQAVRRALESVRVPVFIAPGNHDFITPDSPYLTESWPENVHIFTTPQMESFLLPELGCRVYGAAFQSMDCEALLEGFRAGDGETAIAVLHGDPTVKSSPYNPVSTAQVGASGLSYLALGHIHKGGSLRAKGTLCAWPGCPMGRGFDETGEKGLLVVTLEEKAEARFVPLDTPRFFDLTAEVLSDAEAAVASLLPAAGSEDRYRITITGESEPMDLVALRNQFSLFPYLELTDKTVAPTDLWACKDQDSLEGVYFALLHDIAESQDGETQEIAALAAKISRRLLDGREVPLP